MKDVKMPTSDSYRPSKIERLKDPNYAAAYITAILAEKDPEPELLPKALRNVAEALGEVNMSKEEAILHQQKLEVVLSDLGSYGIYSLVDWLDALGLKLTVSVK